MDHKQLTSGLVALADEAEPASIDVHAVIATAKARTRHRRAGTATVIATVAVAGAMAATIGLVGANETGRGTGSQQTTTTTSPSQENPALGLVTDERSAELTAQLAVAWSELKPPGVTAEPSPEEPPREPLVFSGLKPGTEVLSYEAKARLVDDQGQSNFMISTAIPTMPKFEPCASGSGCTYHSLQDGTQVNVTIRDWATPSAIPQSTLDVLRPDGLRYFVEEHNPFPDGSHDSRPTPVFSVEDLLEFATVLS